MLTYFKRFKLTTTVCLLVNAFACTQALAVDTDPLRQAVTLAGVRTHQAALQGFADANGGTRFDGSPGHFASVDYVANLMQSAGYDVTVQPFTYPTFLELDPPVLEQVAPVATVYPSSDPSGFFTISGSGSGDITALTQGVDVANPPIPGATDSGCEAADFTGFVAGRIAVLQRGACTFALKVLNAEAAGAVGVVVFNEGAPGRTDAINGTLSPETPSIPVVFSSFNVGSELVAGVTARIFVNAITEATSKNVLAETPGGRADHVLLVGAHLDSVMAGPGIQDNGSGSAAILEIALQMSNLGIEPYNKVRFAWWGAGEVESNGVLHYLANLGSGATDDIRFVLDFDMIGSPNFVRFVLDGDGSDGGITGPVGSGLIEQVFLDYFANQGGGLPTEPFGLSPVSDHSPFLAVGIPVGGLFTGAEIIKTASQAAVYGGTAGDQYDPCYHLACDTFDNISLEALDQMSDAAAHAIQTLGAFGMPLPPVPAMSLAGMTIAVLLFLLFAFTRTALASRQKERGL